MYTSREDHSNNFQSFELRPLLCCCLYTAANFFCRHSNRHIRDCIFGYMYLQVGTRHRASTSMYSLTFCVRFLLPERHQRKPAVQAAAVMLKTPSSTANHRRASHAHFPYTAHNFENAPRHPPGRSHYVVTSRDGGKLVTRVRVMLP